VHRWGPNRRRRRIQCGVVGRQRNGVREEKSVKARCVKVLAISALLLGASCLTACDGEDWEDFFDSAADFVNDVRYGNDCRGHDCYGYDDGYWFDFGIW
jgi:hypothetical protein